MTCSVCGKPDEYPVSLNEYKSSDDDTDKMWEDHINYLVDQRIRYLEDHADCIPPEERFL